MNLQACFFSATPIIRGRGVGIGTSDKNIHGPIQIIDWATVFAAAAAVDISSSSAADLGGETPGTGARTVAVYGLDADYNPQSETISLNGQTKVTGSKAFIRVFGAEVLTAGTGKANAGTIYAVKTGTGGTYSGGVPGTLTSAILTVPVGDNVGLSGVYTIPRGEYHEVEEFIGWAATQSGTIKCLTTEPTGLLKPEFVMDIGAGQTFIRSYPKIVIPEKCDIYCRAVAASSTITAGFAIKLRRQ